MDAAFFDLERSSNSDWICSDDLFDAKNSSKADGLNADDLKDIVIGIHKAGLIDKDILETKVKVKLPILGMRTVKISSILNTPPQPLLLLVLRKLKRRVIQSLNATNINQLHRPITPHFPGLKKPGTSPLGNGSTP